MPEKTYTASEVSALLGQAARLQAAGRTPPHEGLTLEEVKAAAAEAGIEPRYVAMASSMSADHGSSSWHIPVEVGRSVVVPGALTDAGWRRMVAVFAHAFGGPGTTETKDGRRRWSRGALHVTAEATEGQVLLHIADNWAPELQLPIALTLVGAVAAGTISALALVSMEWTIGVVAALTTLLVAGAFAAYRSRTTTRQKALHTTMSATLDQCVAMLHEAPASAEALQTAADPAKAGGEAGRIVLPDAETEEAPAALPNLRTRKNHTPGS